MMSTTGRSPVIAAPTPIPVKPASDIGVSKTRSAPNSSTRPDKTLKGVPASATSSPKMHTRESRRISSASASRTAWANVSSRWAASGIDVLIDLLNGWVWRGNGEFNRRFHFLACFVRDFLQLARIRKLLARQPIPHVLDGIALRLPLLLFLLGAVIFAINVAHVMTRIAISVAHEQGRPGAPARPAHQLLRRGMDGAHILPVHAFRMHTERGSARQNVPGRGFRKMRVFRVQVVLAGIDHRQFVQRRQVHHFIQHALPERAFAKETNGNLVALQSFRGQCRTRGNSRAAAYDRVGAKVP